MSDSAIKVYVTAENFMPVAEPRMCHWVVDTHSDAVENTRRVDAGGGLR